MQSSVSRAVLMTPEEINKMIEDRIAEVEKKRLGIPPLQRWRCLLAVLGDLKHRNTTEVLIPPSCNL